MQKVVKFGGSSLANSTQFEKVKNIVLSDPARRIVVVSALGKRTKDDYKITDLLFLTQAHLKYGVDEKSVFQIVKDRYLEVAKDLNLKLDLNKEFEIIESEFSKTIDKEMLVSRGEFLAAKMMAEYLDYKFIDLRSDKNNLVFKVQSTLIRYMREYLYNNNFTENLNKNLKIVKK